MAVACGSKVTYTLDDEGCVWALGKNGANGTYEQSFYNEENIPKKLDCSNIIRIACGGDHCLCIDNQGSVWGIGFNDSYQLGFSSSFFFNDGEICYPPTKLQNLPDAIIEVFCGAKHSFCITSENTVFGFGSNRNSVLGVNFYFSPPEFVKKPTLVQELQSIVSIGTAINHTLFLDANGIVYCCGSNENGQLGFGECRPVINNPIAHPTLPPVRLVCCSYRSSMVVTTEEEIYYFGAMPFGKSFVPLVINVETTTPIIDIYACILDVSEFGRIMILETNGTLWGIGSNIFYQLGMGDDRINRRDHFEKVCIPEPILMVALGDYHTIMRTEHFIYQCGINKGLFNWKHKDVTYCFKTAKIPTKFNKYIGLSVNRRSTRAKSARFESVHYES